MIKAQEVKFFKPAFPKKGNACCVGPKSDDLIPNAFGEFKPDSLHFCISSERFLLTSRLTKSLEEICQLGLRRLRQRAVAEGNV